jgi:hypothetical protein
MIKMKALRSFGVSGSNEGHVSRGREFTLRMSSRAKDLEEHGLAYRLEFKAEPKLVNKMEPPPSNKAAVLRPFSFSWWRDWRGRACAIIASGPSAATAPINRAPRTTCCPSDQGKRAALSLGGCRLRMRWALVARQEWLAEVSGTKLAHDTGVCATTETFTRSRSRPRSYAVRRTRVVGSGGNSGFQAHQHRRAVRRSRILLIGFDMHAAPACIGTAITAGKMPTTRSITITFTGASTNQAGARPGQYGN